MTETIASATLLVRDYDESIAYFTGVLGFALLEDSLLEDGKRWVVVAPTRSAGMNLLLARVSTPEQVACIGHQTGGRVSFFLHTDDFARAHDAMLQRGVRFLEAPRRESYGTVAVFADLYAPGQDLHGVRRETLEAPHQDEESNRSPRPPHGGAGPGWVLS